MNPSSLPDAQSDQPESLPPRAEGARQESGALPPPRSRRPSPPRGCSGRLRLRRHGQRVHVRERQGQETPARLRHRPAGRELHQPGAAGFDLAHRERLATRGRLKPISNAALQELFKKQPFQAQSVIWTLSRTEVPMYAIVPGGAFAAEAYKWLVKEWEDSEVEFVSIPGVLAGQIALYDGQIVDAVVPDLRGMLSWQTKRYVKALRDARRRADSELSDERLDREIDRFFGKIYFSIRNRGLSPEERAVNGAATNAFNVSPVIERCRRGRIGLARHRRRAKPAQPARQRLLRRAAHVFRSGEQGSASAAAGAVHDRRQRHRSRRQSGSRCCGTSTES